MKALVVIYKIRGLECGRGGTMGVWGVKAGWCGNAGFEPRIDSGGWIGGYRIKYIWHRNGLSGFERLFKVRRNLILQAPDVTFHSRMNGGVTLRHFTNLPFYSFGFTIQFVCGVQGIDGSV